MIVLFNKLVEMLADKVAGMAAKGQALQDLISRDAVAAKTEWKPLRRGGRFILLTHKLVEVDAGHVALRASIYSWIFRFFTKICIGSVTAASRMHN